MYPDLTVCFVILVKKEAKLSKTILYITQVFKKWSDPDTWKWTKGWFTVSMSLIINSPQQLWCNVPLAPGVFQYFACNLPWIRVHVLLQKHCLKNYGRYTKLASTGRYWQTILPALKGHLSGNDELNDKLIIISKFISGQHLWAVWLG